MREDCIEHPNTGPHGYASVQRDGKRFLAHRLAWMDAHGPIPDGQVVRHMCHNMKCVNVDHLQLGSQADNIQDTIDHIGHHNANKTHCPKGHEYTEKDRRADGRRQCLACERERYHRNKEKK